MPGAGPRRMADKPCRPTEGSGHLVGGLTQKPLGLCGPPTFLLAVFQPLHTGHKCSSPGRLGSCPGCPLSPHLPRSLPGSPTAVTALCPGMWRAAPPVRLGTVAYFIEVKCTVHPWASWGVGQAQVAHRPQQQSTGLLSFVLGPSWLMAVWGSLSRAGERQALTLGRRQPRDTC